MYRCIVALSGILLVVLSGADVYGVHFDVLGSIDPPYGTKSVYVSDDGSIVLATPTGIHHRDGFLWKKSLGITSWFSASSSSRPLGISGDGQVIVGTENHSFYDPSTIYTYDASFDGSVVVGYRSLGYPSGEGFRAVAGGPSIGLGDLPGGEFSSSASAVSADGTTVVGSSWGADWFQPFRWTAAEGMVPLGPLPGAPNAYGRARDVSGDGTTIVGDLTSMSGVHEAFRWTPATGLQGLGDLSGGRFVSIAYGVSADGNTIVGTGLIEAGRQRERAFIWNVNDGMRNLADVLQNQYAIDLQGVTLRTATSTSADGTVIVGWGTRVVGGNLETVAWRAVIPEPATIIMVLPTILTCWNGRRSKLRRRRTERLSNIPERTHLLPFRTQPLSFPGR